MGEDVGVGSGVSPASIASLSASGLGSALPVASGLLSGTGAAPEPGAALEPGVPPPTDGELGGVVWDAGEVDGLVDGDVLPVGDGLPVCDGLPDDVGEPFGEVAPFVQLGVKEGLGLPVPG